MKEEEKIKISAELKRFVEDLKRIFVTRSKDCGQRHQRQNKH